MIDWLGKYADFPADERKARLRTLQLAVRLMAGPDQPVIALLRRSETDPSLLTECGVELRKLPTRTYRNILASFAKTI